MGKRHTTPGQVEQATLQLIIKYNTMEQVAGGGTWKEGLLHCRGSLGGWGEAVVNSYTFAYFCILSTIQYK